MWQQQHKLYRESLDFWYGLDLVLGFSINKVALTERDLY